MTLRDGYEKPGIDSVYLEIQNSIVKKGSFEWASLSPSLLWAAIQKSNGVVAVGYQTAGNSFRENQLHLIDIGEGNWLRTKQYLINEIVQIEQALSPHSNRKTSFPGRKLFYPYLILLLKILAH